MVADVTTVVDDRPTFPLANILELPDGRVAEWETIGTGEPLLWIEGGPGLPAHLARPDVELLADRFRAHLINAPGCGRSSPPADYSLETHVRYFDEVRRVLGLGRVTVMGHSWGGLVALAFALALPDAVERVIVIDGYAGEPTISEETATAERDRAFDRIRARPWFDAAVAGFDEDLELTARQLDERFEACWPLYFADPESEQSRSHIERLRRETRWNIAACGLGRRSRRMDLLPQLRALEARRWCSSASTTSSAGLHGTGRSPAAIPGAVYAEIPGVGHFPQYEAPDEFRRIVLEWLGRSRWKRSDGSLRVDDQSFGWTTARQFSLGSMNHAAHE